eukprot:GHVS01053423.1.p2 GENE.GHVS01053423.1~~GHVS01053423.1.p2  ORF type:complete len:108 (+),score=10.08 GHVS01053423.1:264-587(+)
MHLTLTLHLGGPGGRLLGLQREGSSSFPATSSSPCSPAPAVGLTVLVMIRHGRTATAKRLSCPGHPADKGLLAKPHSCTGSHSSGIPPSRHTSYADVIAKSFCDSTR